MAASNRKGTREAGQFYRRGRVATEPQDIEEARTRRRGQIVVADSERQRAWNAIDAAYMGQEDYRDGKLMASLERFEARARSAADLRRLDLLDDVIALWHTYKDAYQGRVSARRPRS